MMIVFFQEIMGKVINCLKIQILTTVINDWTSKSVAWMDTNLGIRC